MPCRFRDGGGDGAGARQPERRLLQTAFINDRRRDRPYPFRRLQRGNKMPCFLTFIEGIITFISPCLLPLLPVYLGFFAGGGPQRKKNGALFGALGFILGFTAAFTAMGAVAGGIGAALAVGAACWKNWEDCSSSCLASTISGFSPDQLAESGQPPGRYRADSRAFLPHFCSDSLFRSAGAPVSALFWGRRC